MEEQTHREEADIIVRRDVGCVHTRDGLAVSALCTHEALLAVGVTVAVGAADRARI